MLMRSLFWRLALLGCGVLVWVLLPLSLAINWLATRARAGEQAADMRLLWIQTQLRAQRPRLGGPRR